MTLLNQIDVALGRYYDQEGIDGYFDDNGVGKFKQFCQENGLDDDECIMEDIDHDDPAESLLIDFDDDLFSGHEKREEKIINVIRRCIDDANAYSSIQKIKGPHSPKEVEPKKSTAIKEDPENGRKHCGMNDSLWQMMKKSKATAEVAKKSKMDGRIKVIKNIKEDEQLTQENKVKQAANEEERKDYIEGSIEEKTGLQFPVAHFRINANGKEMYDCYGDNAAILITAVMETMVAEILELAGDISKANGQVEIGLKHIEEAIRTDEEYNELYGHMLSPIESAKTIHVPRKSSIVRQVNKPKPNRKNTQAVMFMGVVVVGFAYFIVSKLLSKHGCQQSSK